MCWACAFDAFKPDTIAPIFKIVKEEIGKLDILINNVGGTSLEFETEFRNITDEAWEKMFQFNLMSMVRFTRCAIPFLLKGRNPSIVNVATAPVKQPGISNAHYVAAKTAMVSVSKHLANEYGRFNLRVNTVCPGSIKGESWDEAASDRAHRKQIPYEEAYRSMQKEVESKTPLGRLAIPHEIASYIVFLCSAGASHITGTCVNVDGGMNRSTF